MACLLILNARPAGGWQLNQGFRKPGTVLVFFVLTCDVFGVGLPDSVSKGRSRYISAGLCVCERKVVKRVTGTGFDCIVTL